MVDDYDFIDLDSFSDLLDYFLMEFDERLLLNGFVRVGDFAWFNEDFNLLITIALNQVLL